MEEKEKSKSKAGLRIGLLIFLLIFVLYMALWNSSRIVYRPKHFCNRAEIDANNIAAAISDYFAIPEHTDIKNSDIARSFTPWNPWTLIKCGEKIYIYVYDRKEDCPVDYQNSYPEWDSHIYTKIFE